MNLASEPNAGSQECVGVSAESKTALPYDPAHAHGSKSLMSSWTSRRSSKRSLKESAGPAAPACPAGRVTSAAPAGQRNLPTSWDQFLVVNVRGTSTVPAERKSSGNRLRACAELCRETPPTRANTRGSGGECSHRQSHGNSPDSEDMSRRFGSYLEVAKRALNRGRNRNVSLC